MPDVSVEEFTEEVTAFFNGNAKLKMAEEKPFVWGEGDDDMSSALFEDGNAFSRKRSSGGPSGMTLVSAGSRARRSTAAAS